MLGKTSKEKVKLYFLAFVLVLTGRRQYMKRTHKAAKDIRKTFSLLPAILSAVLFSCGSSQIVTKGVARGYCQDGCLAETASLFVSAEAVRGPLLEQEIAITYGLSGFLGELLSGKWDPQSGEKRLEVIDPDQRTCYELYRCVHSETANSFYQTEMTLIHKKEGALLDQLISEDYSFDKGNLTYIDHIRKENLPKAERHILHYQVRLSPMEEDASLALRLNGEEVANIAGTPCEAFDLLVESSGKIALSLNHPTQRLFLHRSP